MILDKFLTMPPRKTVRNGNTEGRLIEANYHCTVLEFQELPNNVQALYNNNARRNAFTSVCQPATQCYA